MQGGADVVSWSVGQLVNVNSTFDDPLARLILFLPYLLTYLST
jgi:hypothetical protein